MQLKWKEVIQGADKDNDASMECTRHDQSAETQDFAQDCISCLVLEHLQQQNLEEASRDRHA